MSLEEVSKDGVILTAEDLLEELVKIDSTGLNPRDISDRTVVACYHHAMFLASILRYQGVPVRMRAGFSRFYESTPLFKPSGLDYDLYLDMMLSSR